MSPQLSSRLWVGQLVPLVPASACCVSGITPCIAVFCARVATSGKVTPGPKLVSGNHLGSGCSTVRNGLVPKPLVAMLKGAPSINGLMPKPPVVLLKGVPGVNGPIPKPLVALLNGTPLKMQDGLKM